MRTPAQLNWSRPGLPDDPQNNEYAAQKQSYHDQSVCASGDRAEDDDMLDVKPDIRKLKELLQLHTSRGQVEKAVPASVSGLRRIEVPKPAQKTTVSPPVIRFLKPRRGSPIRRRRSDEENVGEAALRCGEKLFQQRKSGHEKDTRPLKMPTVKVEPMEEDEAPPVLSKMVQNPVNVKAEVFDKAYGDAGQSYRQSEPRPLTARPLQRQPHPYHRAIYQPRLPTVIRPIPTPPREPLRFPVIHSSSHLLPPPKTGFVFSIKSAPPRQPTPPPPPKPKPPPKTLIKHIILKKPKPPPKPPKPIVLGPDGEPRKRGRPRIHPVKPKSDPPRKRGRPRKYPPGSKRPRPRQPPVRKARPIKALRFNSQVRDRSIDWSNYDESKAFIDKEVHVLGEQRTFKLCSSCLEALYEENINKHTLRSHFSRCRGELREV